MGPGWISLPRLPSIMDRLTYAERGAVPALAIFFALPEKFDEETN